MPTNATSSLAFERPTQVSPDKKGRNFGLDALRAAAIIMVIVSHTAGALRSLGIYGVELFFVLSGFLIGDILIRSATRRAKFEFSDLREFWTRRWFRTLPNYYWFLALYLLTWLAAPETAGAVPTGLPFYLVFLQNFAWPGVSGFFGVTWSLAVEEWFYLLFPAVFFLVLKLWRKPVGVIRPGFLRAMLLFLLLPPVLRFLAAYFYPTLAQRFTVVLRLDAIMYGVLLAYLKSWQNHVWTLFRRAWPVGVFGLLAGALLLTRDSVFVQALTFTLLPLSFMLILPAFQSFAQGKGVGAAVIGRISLWSYSIYLCHMLVYDETRALLNYDSRGAAGRVVIKAAAMVLIFAVSALNYRYFERPMTDLRERFKTRESVLSAPV